MGKNVRTNAGKSGFQFGLIVSLEIKPTALIGSFLQQALAGVKADGVGNKIIFSLTAIEFVHVGPQVDVVEGRSHTDQGVVAGRAVVAQRGRGTAPAPAVGEQDDEVLLAPVTDRRLRSCRGPTLVGSTGKDFGHRKVARPLIRVQGQWSPVLAVLGAAGRAMIARVGRPA